MKFGQPVRIILLLVLIFGAGIVTGRLTVPRPPASAVAMDGRILTSDYIFNRMKGVIALTPEQEQQARPLLEETVREISKTPPGSQERIEAFKRWVPKMKAVLRPNQHEAFDRYARNTETRFENAMRLQKKRSQAAAEEKKTAP